MVSVAGNYTVTATDANGCTATASRTLTVNTSPVANISGPSAPCEATNPTFTASGGTGYLWSNGATTPAISPTTAGIYSVTVTDAIGCTDDEFRTVLPSPIAAIAGENNICLNALTTLTASGGLTYLWSTMETSSSIVVSSPGNYSVTATNSSGCIATASKAITVSPLPTPTIIDPATSGGSSLICDGTSTTFSVTGGTSYLWSNGMTTPSIMVSSAGTYSVTVQDGNNCIGMASRPLSVKSAPPAPLCNCLQSFCASEQPVLTNLVATGTGINWYSTPDIGAPVMALSTPLENGKTYYVTQMVDGCESIIKVPVKVMLVTPAPGHQCIGGCSN